MASDSQCDIEGRESRKEKSVQLFDLPVEILIKIFDLLEMRDYLNFSTTCRSLLQLSEELLRRASSSSTGRPNTARLVFSIGSEHNSLFELNKFTSISCDRHQTCPVHNNYGCEISQLERTQSSDSPLESGDICECIYHRIFCMFSARFRTFKTLRIIGMQLMDPRCILRAVEDAIEVVSGSLQINRFPDESEKVQRPIKKMICNNSKSSFLSIDRMEFIDCEISLDWLIQVFQVFDNLIELKFRNIILSTPGAMHSKQSLKSDLEGTTGQRNDLSTNQSGVKTLRFTGDRGYRFSDYIFVKLFYHQTNNIETLDLTSSRLVYHRAIAQRYYRVLDDDIILNKPSHYVFTWALIFIYLKKSHRTVRKLILNKTGITITQLSELLEAAELSHLEIELFDCAELAQHMDSLLRHPTAKRLRLRPRS